MKMNLKNISPILLILSGILILTTCSGPQKYPVIPAIKFEQIILYDTIDDIVLENPVKGYKLRFSLTDGDGNIGLNLEDTIGIEVDSLYVNNFISTLYKIENGDTIIADSSDGYNFRIPDIRPEGQNKVLIADIYIDMSFLYDDGELKFDSVMFDFFIIDRALNKSNLEITPVLFLDTIGIFPPILEEN